ncbi:MAG: YihY/virulence factor BrkB family protein [Bacteroidetes bacterium]|nr:YihY/virulence factor BrkB family protein [Bacteroidota bacterium]
MRLFNGIENTRIGKFAKRASFVGFEGVPIYDVASFFFKEIKKEAITMRASALAFNFFLALFPATVFLFTLIAYIPVDNLQERVLDYLAFIMPTNAYESIRVTIEDIINRQRGGLLSVGFILALFFATNGVNTLIRAFNKNYDTFKVRSFLHRKLVSLELTVMLSLMVIVSVVLIVAGEQLFDWLLEFFNIQNNTFSYLGYSLLRWLVIILLFFNSISLLYYVGPATREKWQFISVGSSLATVLIILTSLGFSYFINAFGTYNKIYGSIGTLIGVMLWFYFNSLVLLIGFELNTSIKVSKSKLEKG